LWKNQHANEMTSPLTKKQLNKMAIYKNIC